jgi:hypothetical protein
MRRLFRPDRPVLPLLLALIALLGMLGAPRSGYALRFASYNTLNYDNLNTTRDPAFRTVIAGIANVDVLAVCEIQDQTSINNFLNNVLNTIEPGQWSAAPFYDQAGSSQNQSLFYRSATVTYVSSDTLGNDPRDIPYYRLRPKPYTASSAEFVVFVVHFKASEGYEADRLAEATRLRAFMNTYPAGTNMVICGDFNVYTSTEPAYVELLESQAVNTGRVQDPINTPGSWNNTATYAAIHTQSTRSGTLVPADGGATGGMDDRFDFVLPTYSLNDGEGLDQLASTYTAYGQDGLHFNTDVNAAPTNAAVGQVIADALQRASDHLPVVMNFQVPAIVSASASLGFGTVIVGGTAQQSLTVTNTATVPADELTYTLSAPAGFTAPGGTLTEAAGGGSNSHTIAMLTATAGVKGGNLVISSDDPDNPSKNVPLSGTVLRHAVPSLASGVQTLADTLDFGSHKEGEFTNGSAPVSNVGYDTLQALLNVYGAVITGGDGRFSLVPAFSPVDVNGTPASFTVAFDDAGAATSQDTTFTATLTFSTRDQQGLSGAINLSSLTVYLKATVQQAEQIGVEERPPVTATMLRANYPNPFSASTRIQFDLLKEGDVRIEIFDVRGRLVSTVLDRVMGSGAYDIAWDGLTAAGRETSPGIYFYRLTTQEYTATRRMTKLR